MREYKHKEAYKRVTIWITEDSFNTLHEVKAKTKLNNNSEHVRRALTDYYKKLKMKPKNNKE